MRATRTPSKYLRRIEPDMARDYLSGLSYAAIAAKYRVSEETARRHVQAQGIRSRQVGRPSPEYLRRNGKPKDHLTVSFECASCGAEQPVRFEVVA